MNTTRIITGAEILSIPNWGRQLAGLTKKAWTGSDGKCYFPYKPLTTPKYWKTVVGTQWETGEKLSWCTVQGSKIIGHAALVKKEAGYECGRWVADSSAPKGTMTGLVKRALKFATEKNWKVWVEAIQAHTASQKICMRLGMRFAGIGILDKIGGSYWDILYFDTCNDSLVPRKGILATVCGTVIPSSAQATDRLQMIPSIITNDACGDFPATRFHILSELEPVVREIIKLNTS